MRLTAVGNTVGNSSSGKEFNDKCTSSSTTIAYSSNTNFRVLDSQHRCQCCYNSCTRTTVNFVEEEEHTIREDVQLQPHLQKHSLFPYLNPTTWYLPTQQR